MDLRIHRPGDSVSLAGRPTVPVKFIEVNICTRDNRYLGSQRGPDSGDCLGGTRLLGIAEREDAGRILLPGQTIGEPPGQPGQEDGQFKRAAHLPGPVRGRCDLGSG